MLGVSSGFFLKWSGHYTRKETHTQKTKNKKKHTLVGRESRQCAERIRKPPHRAERSPQVLLLQDVVSCRGKFSSSDHSELPQTELKPQPVQHIIT